MLFSVSVRRASCPLDLIGALSAVPREFWAQPGVDFRATVVGQQQPLRSTIQQEIYSIGREALGQRPLSFQSEAYRS